MTEMTRGCVRPSRHRPIARWKLLTTSVSVKRRPWRTRVTESWSSPSRSRDQSCLWRSFAPALRGSLTTRRMAAGEESLINRGGCSPGGRRPTKCFVIGSWRPTFRSAFQLAPQEHRDRIGLKAGCDDVRLAVLVDVAHGKLIRPVCDWEQRAGRGDETITQQYRDPAFVW